MNDTLITLDSTVTTLAVLSLAISHMGWLITSSGLARPLRERVSHPILREGVHCSICTITQLSLLLAWLVPDVLLCPSPFLLPLCYLLKAMLLAKLSCLVYDLGEVVGTLPLVMNSAVSIEDMDDG